MKTKQVVKKTILYFVEFEDGSVKPVEAKNKQHAIELCKKDERKHGKVVEAQ